MRGTVRTLDDEEFIEDLRITSLPPTDEQITKVMVEWEQRSRLNEVIQSWPILVIRDLPLPRIVRIYLMGGYLWLRGFRDARTG